MASNRGYTTATKVRDVLAGQVNGYFTDAMIENAINRMEGVIDAKLKISSNQAGGTTFTWATGKSAHWVVEGAATYGAALQICGPSILSWNTLDQLVNAQNLYSYMLNVFMKIIENEDDGTFVRNE